MVSHVIRLRTSGQGYRARGSSSLVMMNTSFTSVMRKTCGWLQPGKIGFAQAGAL
jgi:hypothetical protein